MAWNEFNRIVQGWLRWRRRQRALRWGGRALAAGLGAALALGLLLLWQRQLLANEFLALAAAGALLGLAPALLAGLLWPLDRLHALRACDLDFHLQERASTAWELHQLSPVGPNAENWRQRQLDDALTAARDVQLPRLRLEHKTLLLSAVLMLALALTAYLGRPQFEQAQQQRQVAQAIQNEAARLETLSTAIQDNSQLSEAQKEALLAPLQEALKRMQEANTPEQALSALEQAEQKLTEISQQMPSEAELQALEQLGQSEDSPLKEAGQALAEKDFARAAEEFQNLDLQQMSAGQRQALSDELNQAASELQNTDPQTAAKLQQAAQALQDGQLSEAQQALQEVAQALEQTGEQYTLSEAAGEQAQELQEGQALLAQTTNAAQDQTGQPIQILGQGQPGSGGQQNAANAGGGAGRGEANSSQQNQAGEAGNTPIAQNNGPGDGGEQQYESVYTPQRLGGESQTGMGLDNSGQPGQAIGQQNSDPSQPQGQSQVPYVEVLPGYSAAYRQAIENGEAPPHLLPVIHDYFSSLEP